ncbi:hypothetical protein BC833DRAFT_585803 [Globomyces pollinis-pini]|nr:hypothetical protein BC833DRAFT_585803 [Globomyces pollinis-pini]
MLNQNKQSHQQELNGDLKADTEKREHPFITPPKKLLEDIIATANRNKNNVEKRGSSVAMLLRQLKQKENFLNTSEAIKILKEGFMYISHYSPLDSYFVRLTLNEIEVACLEVYPNNECVLNPTISIELDARIALEVVESNPPSFLIKGFNRTPHSFICDSVTERDAWVGLITSLLNKQTSMTEIDDSGEPLTDMGNNSTEQMYDSEIKHLQEKIESLEELSKSHYIHLLNEITSITNKLLGGTKDVAIERIQSKLNEINESLNISNSSRESKLHAQFQSLINQSNKSLSAEIGQPITIINGDIKDMKEALTKMEAELYNVIPPQDLLTQSQFSQSIYEILETQVEKANIQTEKRLEEMLKSMGNHSGRQETVNTPSHTFDRPTKNMIVSMNDKLIQLGKLHEHGVESHSQRLNQIERKLPNISSMRLEQTNDIIQIKSLLQSVDNRLARLERDRANDQQSVITKLQTMARANANDNQRGNNDKHYNYGSDSGDDVQQESMLKLEKEIKELKQLWQSEQQITQDRMSQFINMFSMLQDAHTELLTQLKKQPTEDDRINQIFDMIKELKTQQQGNDKEREELSTLTKTIHSNIVSYLPLNLETKLFSIEERLKKLSDGS